MIQEAFDQLISDAIWPNGQRWYLILVETIEAYGGPEEGGWTYPIQSLLAYKDFPSEEQADAARASVEKLAEELARDAREAHGRMCLEQMEWLDARGLESDYLPEVDSPAQYSVSVVDTLPMFDNTKPIWC